MKIKRSVIEKIAREELVRHLGGMLGEASKAPDVTDAQDDNKKKPTDQDEKDELAAGDGKNFDKPVDKKGKTPAPPAGKVDPSKGKKAPDLPTEEEPADKKLDEPIEDASEVTGGKISKELVGKTVQSLTMEPKSKIMPGAQEIVLQFDQIPDPLRILIGKTGVVRYYFQGLHNSL